MRRTGNLYDAIHDPENLRLAFCKARRGKEDRREVRKFARDLEGNLSRLRDDLAGETAAVGEYRHFRVRDPKERTIYAAAFPERVLHHAVMNVCDPVFERFQIFDSYATRRGKGTFAALERARRFTGSNAWFLKLDVRKYFDSVDHGILKGQLRRLFSTTSPHLNPPIQPDGFRAKWTSNPLIQSPSQSAPDLRQCGVWRRMAPGKFFLPFSRRC